MSKSLIIKNEFNLPEHVVSRLVALHSSGAMAPLSRERESGPFLLFCTGFDFDAIALQTNIPLDVIYLTAIQYNWLEKATLLRKDPASVQKDIANSLLVATSLAVKEELEDIIAGRKSAKSSSLIPKTVAGIDNLIKMVSNLNGITLGDATTGKGGTVIQAQNVQINNNNIEEDRPLEIGTEKEREAKYNPKIRRKTKT